MPSPSNTDSNFERTFADLAYARLRDKAPTLLDYLIGFQLIDKNEDETHAVGVFGFKVASEWIYAPVFFINGELKGHELMYIKSQDMFAPMTEEWVNYILNRRPAMLGEKERTPRNMLSIKQPDFDLFARVPYIGSKYASAHKSFKDICGSIHDDFKGFMEVFTVSPATDEKFASLAKRFTIPAALNILPKQAAYSFFKAMKEDEKFADAVLSFYDINTLVGHEKTAEKLTQDEAQYKPDAAFSPCKTCNNFSGGGCKVVGGSISTNGTCRYYQLSQVKNDLRPIGPLDSDQPVGTKTASDTHTVPMDAAPYRNTPDKKVVVIIRGDDLSNMTYQLTDADKQKLLKDQYIVKDERSDDRRSRVYKSQLAATVSGPTESGIFDVVVPGGGKQKMLVIWKPIRIGFDISNHPIDVTLVDPAGKRFGNFNSSDVLIQGRYGNLEQADGLIDINRLKPGETAILVAPDNKATNVFKVGSKVTNQDGLLTIDVDGCQCESPMSTNQKVRHGGHLLPYDDTDRVTQVVVSPKPDARLSRICATLFVPSTYKALVVKPKPPEKENGIAHYSDSSTVMVGSLTDLAMSLTKSANVHELRLLTDGLGFNVVLDGKHGPRMSKVAMIQSLIITHGLAQVDAETLLKEAQPRQAKKYYIKYAAESQPSAAWFPEPVVGQEYGINAPVQYPMQMSQNLGSNDTLANREVYRDDRTMDYAARRYAQQAAEGGQKEVLDTSVIGGLVKTLDVDDKIDSYIGDLLLGLDRLGRILFQYYWFHDKFKERFGSQDMVELEDNLRNVFKNLGELTLFLKQKEILPESTETNSEAGLTDVLG